MQIFWKHYWINNAADRDFTKSLIKKERTTDWEFWGKRKNGLFKSFFLCCKIFLN